MSAKEGIFSPDLGDSLRRVWQRVLGKQETASYVPASAGQSGSRRSNGLSEFWKTMQSQPGAAILDLGSASQANVNFITGLGYKLYAADVYSCIKTGIAPATPGEVSPQDNNPFLSEQLSYTEGQFEGVLCWDLLDFLPEDMIKPLVDVLYRAVKPGGSLLAFFHAGQLGESLPLYQYRIAAQDAVQPVPRGQAALSRSFNNRTIENLFRRFVSLKFFLGRDKMREVVIVR